MNEQRILLLMLVLSLAATLGLYVYKAVKQVRYQGDERWQMIQLKANNAANLVNWLLLVLLFILQMTAAPADVVRVQRVVTLGLVYIGVRNLIELAATVGYDRKM